LANIKIPPASGFQYITFFAVDYKNVINRTYIGAMSHEWKGLNIEGLPCAALLGLSCLVEGFKVERKDDEAFALIVCRSRFNGKHC
jgi:hypothetical protein